MITIGLFGSELTIRDGFSQAFSSFTGQARNAKGGIDGLARSIKDTESQYIKSISGMKGQAIGLAEVYRSTGLSQSESMRRAWNKIEGDFKKSSKNIKNDGSNTFKDLTNNVNSFSNSTLGALSKITAGYLSLKGAVGLVKTATKDASEFQNASIFLGAVYGEQQGKEKYKWATKEANETPFEEDEVASGLARAKSLGLKDDEGNFKMYEDLGSYAKIQKVGNLNSAIDALSDAQNGEWERLQTITGTKRQALEDYAKQKGLGKFTNKKGQVTDKEKLMSVLKSYMDDKGITGMTDKFSKTFDGRMSTLKGNFKKSFAELAGIAEDGTIKSGSMFDKFSNGIEKMITSVNSFSKSESFERIADGLSKLGNGLIGGLDYITQHPELPGIIGKLGVGIALLKVSNAVFSPLVKVSSTLGLLGNTAKTSSLMLGKAALGVGLFAVAANSFFGQNGKLHNFANNIWNYGKKDGEKADVADTTKAIFKSGWNSLQYGGAKLLGRENAKQEFDTRQDKILTDWQESDNQINNVYNNFSNDKGSKWETIPNMIANGNVTKNNTNNTVQNKIDVNFNVDTVRETADIDDIMDIALKRVDKYTNTRNNLAY